MYFSICLVIAVLSCRVVIIRQALTPLGSGTLLIIDCVLGWSLLIIDCVLDDPGISQLGIHAIGHS
jgi:hypothetical protein